MNSCDLANCPESAVARAISPSPRLYCRSEFMSLESENTPADGGPVDDTLLMGGAFIAF